ncbi:MAG: hypothetical protein QGD90_01060 [Candidatus Hydrogenedentes bacterium]|nr:hypothetical protein [Candidatus Hydrogenedentota bacterium]
MRFMLGDFTSAGAEILDSRNMSVAYLNVDTIEAAQSHVDFRNLISEKLRRLDLDITELEARLRADFGKGAFGNAA